MTDKQQIEGGTRQIARSYVQEMKKVCAVSLCACLSLVASAQQGGALQFDGSAGVKSTMVLYDGSKVTYTAYERLYYVTNVEDSAYQYLNIGVGRTF